MVESQLLLVCEDMRKSKMGVLEMVVIGFNVGSTMCLKDISLAIDYLTDKSIFEPDLQDIKDKITNKESENA